MRNESVHIAGKLSYREELEQLWSKEPLLSIENARKRTGAPKAVARTVRQRLVDAGKLKKNHWRAP